MALSWEVALEADESLVQQLSAMGFDTNGCRRACLATKNQGVEAAMEWVLQHMGDPDFSSPPRLAMFPAPLVKLHVHAQ